MQKAVQLPRSRCSSRTLIAAPWKAKLSYTRQTSWPSFSATTCPHSSTSRIARCLSQLTQQQQRRPQAPPTRCLQKRQFTSTSPLSYKTIQEARSRYRSGPFSWGSGLFFLAAGAGLYVYLQFEKGRMERKRVAEAAKGVGRPKVGGKFELLDQEGRIFTDQDLKEKYALVYFGFTHCPDICPEELDKMAHMIDLVKESCGNVMKPIFITCDPARDTPAVVKTYLQEFHPALIGLTGSWDQVKAVCKLYRVYFSTPPSVKPGQDYLVDHSIYFYLMDPDGDFVEAIGRQHSAERAAKIIAEHVGDWRGKLNKE